MSGSPSRGLKLFFFLHSRTPTLNFCPPFFSTGFHPSLTTPLLKGFFFLPCADHFSFLLKNQTFGFLIRQEGPGVFVFTLVPPCVFADWFTAPPPFVILNASPCLCFILFCDFLRRTPRLSAAYSPFFPPPFFFSLDRNLKWKTPLQRRITPPPVQVIFSAGFKELVSDFF